MSLRFLLLFAGYFMTIPVLVSKETAQQDALVEGTVLDRRSKKPIAEGIVRIEGSDFAEKIGNDGTFGLLIELRGDHILNISSPDYITKRIPITLENKPLGLGSIYLERDIVLENSDNLIALTESDLADDEEISGATGLLQATRDIFLNRAAFDFGQAFFRVRGYDSQYGEVLLNGIPLNKFYDGRPQWNNWGGLNDVTRNQQFTNGLQATDHTFGGILGTTNIEMRPSGLRSGTRVSFSASNRTYAGRTMITYNSEKHENGFNYLFSASRRWSKQGAIEGTLYDAFSVFASLEYALNTSNTLHFTGILASNRRGRSSALTQEVFELAGKRYNPYWGYQDGKIRNSRERRIVEPIILLNHYYTSDNFKLNTGIAYQFGTTSRSRLGYYNAPNPDPTYYRYLPSFYINSPIGANFMGAKIAREGFLDDPQLQWEQLYTANRDEAVYLLYEDTTDDKQFTINTNGTIALLEKVKVDFGGTYRQLSSDNYAKIQDLLGAEFYVDIDPFSDTRNDMYSDINKFENDIFGYHYLIHANSLEAFTQIGVDRKKWNGFLSAKYSQLAYQRKGLFQNERFLDNSIGKSQALVFKNYGLKAGFSFKITGRHFILTHGALITKPPTLQNAFINPRENNLLVPRVQSETISAIDFNYLVRMPLLTGRLTGFYTRFQNTTDVNFFFVDAGIGSDFVQEVITDLDKLHKGIELGLEYQLSPTVKITGVAALGKYVIASNPNVAINFDTAGVKDDLINLEGNASLGIAKVKDYKLAQGPQKALALGLEYRDPKYWWLGASANYLANNYINISTISRTPSFYMDPETGQPFPNATIENVNRLLAQSPLDNFYLLNLVGGKSWLKKGKYISVFASINNVFDVEFKTGGYEQSRNGNFGQLQQDNLGSTPSFAPKYWFGYGRTYFLNLAYSF
jgi:hypothetical protein